MKDLIENKISSEAIFKGKVLDIRCDKVTLPNGKIGTREYINHPGAVCCVPILNDGSGFSSTNIDMLHVL